MIRLLIIGSIIFGISYYLKNKTQQRRIQASTERDNYYIRDQEH